MLCSATESPCSTGDLDQATIPAGRAQALHPLSEEEDGQIMDDLLGEEDNLPPVDRPHAVPAEKCRPSCNPHYSSTCRCYVGKLPRSHFHEDLLFPMHAHLEQPVVHPSMHASCMDAGHFACRRPSVAPSELELRALLPGHDGSAEVFTKGSRQLKLPLIGSHEANILENIALDVAKLITLKLQHSLSIKAFDNFLALKLQDENLKEPYRRLYIKYASNHEDALALLAAKGYKVSVIK